MSSTRLFATTVLLAAAPGLALAQPTFLAERVVSAGKPQKLDYFLALDPTCHSMGPITINLLGQPHAGRVEVIQGREYPGFVQTNARSHCNTRKVAATQLLYTAAPGYTGEDEFTIERVGPYGAAQRVRYHVTVR